MIRQRPDDQAHQPDARFDTRLIWASLFASLAIFAKVPNLDLWFSQRYYTGQLGFFHADNPVVLALYHHTPIVGRGLLVLALLVAIGAPRWSRLAHAMGRERIAGLMAGLWRRTAILALGMAVISSGLVVELGLKNNVGRPRPAQTIEFGGAQAFHPVFTAGHNPDRHRSFISGHAGAGFSLMCVGWWAAPVWRRRWFLIGLATGSIVGLGRIMQGGHYLSDVVFSFYAVWLSCELVAFVMRRWDARHRPTDTPPAT